MRHFAHNIGDYAAATRHLSFVEDAAYRRLLDRYYQDEKPLPPDLNAVTRLAGARTKEERLAVLNVLAEFFTLEDDGYHQSRADREIEAYQAKAKAARENGTKGGRPVNREKTKTVSEQVRPEKLTTPHSPLNSSEPNGSGVPPSARETIFREYLPWVQEKLGRDREHCATQMGLLVKDAGGDYDIALAALKAARETDAANPFTYAKGCMKPRETHDQRRIREAREAIQ